MGHFMATVLALLAFPALFVSAIIDDSGPDAGHEFLHAAVVSMGKQTGTREATRCCFNTCSGSSAIRGLTSSPCRPFGHRSPTCSVSMQEKHLRAIG